MLSVLVAVTFLSCCLGFVALNSLLFCGFQAQEGDVSTDSDADYGDGHWEAMLQQHRWGTHALGGGSRRGVACN